MSLEEADDAALGTVRLSEPGENWNAWAALHKGAAALLVAGDAALLKAVHGQHTESIVSQRSVVRYAWSRVAAGASGRPTWTDWAGNHLEGVE